MLLKVALVTPVHNRRDLTLQCLRSLKRIEDDGLDVRIYVVDDGSTDGTAEAIVEQFADVNVVPGDGDLWYSEGSNAGIRAALEDDPDYILVFNNDTVFDSSFLKSMINTAAKNKRTVVGALLLLWDEPHRVFQVSPQWSAWHGGFRHWNKQTVWSVPESPWEVDIIVGNCVLFPVEAIRECGLMDSKRFPHFGDAEYTPRMKRMGWKLVIDPQARAFCQPNDTPPSVRSMGFKQMFSTLILDSSNANSLRRRFFANVLGGPGKMNGILAFGMFFARLALKRNIEGNWALEQNEPPIKETFADRILTPNSN